MSQAHDLGKKKRTDDVLTESSINFASMLLSDTTLSGLKKGGFLKPSPVQLKAIPIGKCGFDLVVKSKSGTGKTAVFSIIALEMINVKVDSLQVLILAPTREIAFQITDVINAIGSDVIGLKTHCFIGGLPMHDDEANLKLCHIAVGAPGRIKHLIDKGLLKTALIKLFVLDEADKLMESSYQSDINYIYNKMPLKKQMIALSATYPDKLDSFLARYMHTPTHITPNVDTPLLLGLKQYVSVVKSNLNVIHQMNFKVDELFMLLSKICFTQCLIFSNFQTRVESLTNKLNQKGWKCVYISAAQSQVKRLEAVKDLKDFNSRILLSTDLTARGIDASNVDLVINFDVPHDASTYLHRMGRAGRYGSKGVCITLAANGKELMQLQNILASIGGTELTIAKLPEASKFPENLWESDPKSFEQIAGVCDENFVSEHNARIKNIKNSIFDLKNSKGDKQNEIIESTNEMELDSIDSQKVLEVMAESKTSLLCGNDDAIDPQALLLKLATGEAIDMEHDAVEALMENSDASTKRKRNELASNSPSSSALTLHQDKRKTTETCQKNLALLNTSKLLCGDITDDIKPNDVQSMGDFISVLREEKIEPIESEVVANDVGQDEVNPLEDIFVVSYSYALNPKNIHWRDALGIKHVEAEEVEETKNEPVNLLEDFDNIDWEEYDAAYEEENEPLQYNQATQNNNTAVAQNPGQVLNLEWLPVNQVPTGFYSHEQFLQNELFTSYFKQHADSLARTANNFEDASSFDNWFLQWQQQVGAIRDYVQQKIYLQEMNRYQYFMQQ